MLMSAVQALKEAVEQLPPEVLSTGGRGTGDEGGSSSRASSGPPQVMRELIWWVATHTQPQLLAQPMHAFLTSDCRFMASVHELEGSVACRPRAHTDWIMTWHTALFMHHEVIHTHRPTFQYTKTS